MLQVAVELPRRDLLVGGLHLAALAFDEVVEVVAVRRPPERLADHVVALELARRVEQVLGQGVDPELGALRRRRLVQVHGVRVAALELALDPVEAGGEQHGGGQVRVAGSVHGPVLDPAGRRHAQHLRAVVVAVGDVDRRPGRARARVAHLQPLVGVHRRRGDRDVGLGVLHQARDEVVARLGEAEPAPRRPGRRRTRCARLPTGSCGSGTRCR